MISVLQTGNVYEFRGLSTDTKPTNVGNGCLFIELDTGNIYLFNKVDKQWLLFGNAGGGGSSATLIEKIITENGVYTASSDNADGYSKVTVTVASKRFNVPSLPSEYQEVEYLSTSDGATGHPYVKVDYSLNVGDCIECGFKGLHTILGPDNAWNFHINDNLSFSIYNNGGYTYGIGYQPYTDNAIGKFVLTFSAVGSQTYFNYGL